VQQRFWQQEQIVHMTRDAASLAEPVCLKGPNCFKYCEHLAERQLLMDEQVELPFPPGVTRAAAAAAAAEQLSPPTAHRVNGAVVADMACQQG